MPSAPRILIAVVFGVVAVMVVTAAIHLVAPYAAVLIVGSPVVWWLTRTKPPSKGSK